MKLRKRSKGESRDDAAPASEPEAASDEPAPPISEPEAVVDSDAVELTGAPPAPEPAAHPVTVAQSPARPGTPAPEIPIVDGVPRTTPPSYDGHAYEPPADPLEPIRAIADARPELVVGAAFAGGVVAAMILRRLGN